MVTESGKVRKALAKLADGETALDGQSIQEGWFPQVNADVFLSHSHRNEDASAYNSGRRSWLATIFPPTLLLLYVPLFIIAVFVMLVLQQP